MEALGAMFFVMILWYIIYIVQMFLSYGTAYRYTRNGGDNGIALFGWMLVFMLASAIPGLGFFLWSRNRNM